MRLHCSEPKIHVPRMLDWPCYAQDRMVWLDVHGPADTPGPFPMSGVPAQVRLCKFMEELRFPECPASRCG